MSVWYEYGSKEFFHKISKVWKYSEASINFMAVTSRNKFKHECDSCGMTFDSQKRLKMHVSASHEQEKNFKGKHITDAHDIECESCEKVFANKESLVRHINKFHKEIKKVKSFDQRGNLNAHLSGAHKKIQNFECDNCEKRFEKASYLRQHVNTKKSCLKFKSEVHISS